MPADENEPMGGMKCSDEKETNSGSMPADENEPMGGIKSSDEKETKSGSISSDENGLKSDITSDEKETKGDSMSADGNGLRCGENCHSMFSDGKKLRSGSSSAGEKGLQSGKEDHSTSAFSINSTTSHDICSMNENNSISAQSLQRFQQWKPGLAHEECWIDDEVS